ncbi:MAG TPA: MBL fold metallo-hydrolase [Desulfomicrobiaceae bacterium]|nr:MBL fold metallo-hydrolase [Desulfomicrobiaceae bacterium]
MSTRIAVLMDNTGRPEFGHEHGLSMAVTLKNGHIWIWDTGQSPTFLRNAHTLGIRPETAHGVALSHGHYDHTGGLDALLDAGFGGRIHAHPEFARSRFSIAPNRPIRDIALKTEDLPRILERLVPVRKYSCLDNGLTMITDIGRQPGRFEPVQGFYRDRNGRSPDPVPDDACLLLESDAGTVLILGCCHSGFANTWAHIRDTQKTTKLHAVIGGLHLINAPDTAMEETREALVQTGAELILPCHCTGSQAVQFLQHRLGKRVMTTGAGDMHIF